MGSKALLQLLLKISDSIARLESLLLITAPQDGDARDQTAYSSTTNGISDEKYVKIVCSGFLLTMQIRSTKANRAKHLLRIASEYNQLLYHASKASTKSCMFVTENHWVGEMNNEDIVCYC